MKFQMIMIMSYISLALILGVVVIRRFRTGKMYVLIPEILFAIFSGCENVLAKLMMSGKTPTKYSEIIMGLPTSLHIALFSFLDVYSLYIIFREYYKRKNSINAGSIRRAINSMDCGLLFSDTGGAVVSANKRMRDLAFIFDSNGIMNGEDFWRKIISFSENAYAKRIDFTTWPAFLLNDNSVWSFQRSVIYDADKKYMEIVARNVTALYQRRLEKEDEIENLSKLREQLKEILDKIAVTGNEEELLAYKVRVHDQLGNAVLRTRKVLRDNHIESLEVANILDVWSNTIKAFKNNMLEVEHNKAGSMEHLYKQAATLGIDLVVIGKFPEYNEVAIRCVREAMYNSIRHAYANTLTVECRSIKEGYNVRIYDDGKADSVCITEGGGLKALRKAVEEIGGTMSVGVYKGVELNFAFPKADRMI